MYGNILSRDVAIPNVTLAWVVVYVIYVMGAPPHNSSWFTKVFIQYNFNKNMRYKIRKSLLKVAKLHEKFRGRFEMAIKIWHSSSWFSRHDLRTTYFDTMHIYSHSIVINVINTNDSITRYV